MRASSSASGVHAIFGLIEHDLCGPSITAGGDFFAAMRGQAVHEERGAEPPLPSGLRDLIGPQRGRIAFAVRFIAHRRPDVGVHDIDIAHGRAADS